MTANSPHAELIETLNEFYTLLDDLSVLEPGVLRRPDVTTGRHAAGEINTYAARAAGYSEDAIEVICQLPYLHEAGIFEILPSTFPTSYLGSELDEGSFEWRREMLFDALMPPSAIRLTSNSGACGHIIIYDVETREYLL